MSSLYRASRTLVLLAATAVALHASAQDERQAYMERAKMMASYYGAMLELDEKTTMALLPLFNDAERSVLDLRRDCEQLAGKMEMDRREMERAMEKGMESDPEKKFAAQKLEDACAQMQERLLRAMMPHLERAEKSLTGEQRDMIQRMRDAGEWEQPAACCDGGALPGTAGSAKPEKIDRSLGCCHWVVVDPMGPAETERLKRQQEMDAAIEERKGRQDEAPGLRSVEKDDKKAPKRK
jgi:hypothetical protein